MPRWMFLDPDHLLIAGGDDEEDVGLWHLGNLSLRGRSSVVRSPEAVMVATAGLGTSLAFALVTAIGLNFADAQQVFNPFGHESSGAPLHHNGTPVPTFSAV